MPIRIKEEDMTPTDAILQPSSSRKSVDGAEFDPPSSLTEFYESEQGLDEDESEVDLMIQLSGMVYSHQAGEE
jgi:hypothetical protein